MTFRRKFLRRVIFKSNRSENGIKIYLYKWKEETEMLKCTNKSGNSKFCVIIALYLEIATWKISTRKTRVTNNNNNNRKREKQIFIPTHNSLKFMLKLDWCSLHFSP